MSKILQAGLLKKILSEYTDDAARAASQNVDEVVDPNVLNRVTAEIAQEADQAVVPMGSGDRLAALLKARENAPDLNDLNKLAQTTESVDDVSRAFQQGDDVIQAAKRTEDARLLGEAVDKGPSNFTMPDPNASVPMARPNTMPGVDDALKQSDEASTALAKQAPEAADQAIDTTAKQITDATTDAAKVAKKPISAKKIAAGTVAAGGAGAIIKNMMDGVEPKQEIQIPLKPQSQQEKKEDKPLQQAKTEEQKQSVQQVLAKVTNPQQSKEEKIDAMSNYIKMLDEAQKRDDKNEFLTTMLRAAIQAGAAIGMTKADYSGVDALEKQTKEVDKLKTRMSTEKAYREMTEESKLADPNSAISKQTRTLLLQMGYPVNEKTSAKQLKDMGVNVYNLMGQEKAQEAKMEVAKLQEGKQKNAFIKNAQKSLMKPFQDFQKVDSAFQSLNRLASDTKIKPGPKDVSMLYDFIKTLDPGSVVREGEIALMRQGMSRIEAFERNFKNIINSDILNPSFRNALVDVARSKRDMALQNYNQLKQPFMKEAISMGLDESDFDRFDYASEQKQEADPNRMVTVTRLSDGVKKQMPFSKTAGMDKNKYSVSE